MATGSTPEGAPWVSGPLAGVRVLELAGIGPVPFAGMLLGDLGADVVRLDRPGGPGLSIDPARDVTHRNKRAVPLDLKAPDGSATLLELVERADVLLEGHRPGVTERLGVGPGPCLARNPRLVYGRMTGWGQDGPLAPRAGHDVGYVALSGALSMIGPPDGPPAVPANLLGDYAGGSLYLVVGVLAALQHARTTGTGQVVDAAVVDGTAHLTSMIHGMLAAGAWQDRRGANLLDGGCPYYGTYRTADDGWMAVGALERRFYDEFARLLGLGPQVPDRDDPRNWPALRAAVAARFRTRGRAEWTEVFADSDACVAPVLSLTEAPHHPHLAARATFTAHDGLVQPAPAPRFSATPTAVRRPPARPSTGPDDPADTAEVAADWGVPALLGTPGGAVAGPARVPDRPDAPDPSGARDPSDARDPTGTPDPTDARDPTGTPDPTDARDPTGTPDTAPEGRVPPAPGADHRSRHPRQEE